MESDVNEIVGPTDGLLLGDVIGLEEGNPEGMLLGFSDGEGDGTKEGLWVG